MSQPTEDQIYKDRLKALMEHAKPLANDLNTLLAQSPDTLTSSVIGSLQIMAGALDRDITALSKLEMRYRSQKAIRGQTTT